MSEWMVTAPAVSVRVGQHVHIVECGQSLPSGVSAATLARLARKGMVTGGVELESEPVVVQDVEVAKTVDSAVPDFHRMNLDQLRSYAAGNGVDLGGATRKNDVIAALTTA